MGSKGRAPPPHLRRPLPGPAMMHPDPYGPPIRPPPSALPHFDMLAPPEVLEQKLAAQHAEMQKLAAENQRLAATHGTLRQELAAAQHELQMLHTHIGAMKSEKEQQTKELLEKIGRMEAEIQAAEPIKLELQQARTEAQTLVAARQELMSKAQQLSQDLHRAQSDCQQIPPLLSELESLRQEYQHCRATYDYEKKLYNDHLESLQVMEKNYMIMAQEVEKLRAELSSTANFDRRTGAQYGGSTGYGMNDAAGNYAGGHNFYGDGYVVAQGRGPVPASVDTASGTSAAGVVVNSGGPNAGAQSGSHGRASYDASKVSSYDAPRGAGGPSYEAQRGASGSSYDAQRLPTGPGYEAQRGVGYDAQRGSGYDAHRGPGYDGYKAPVYDGQRGSSYDVQRGVSYDAHKGPGYDAASRGTVGPQGSAAPINNVPYGSATPPAHATTYDAPARGGNPVRR